MTTLTAKELYEKYLNDLEALRNACPHENTEWMSEQWAPGHSTGARVKVCKNCEATIDRQSQVEYLITEATPNSTLKWCDKRGTYWTW